MIPGYCQETEAMFRGLFERHCGKQNFEDVDYGSVYEKERNLPQQEENECYVINVVIFENLRMAFLFLY